MEFPSTSYTWKIDTAKDTLRDHRSGQGYQGADISMFGLRWHFRFVLSHHNKGYAVLCLDLCKMPPVFSSFTLKCTSAFQELGFDHTMDEIVFGQRNANSQYMTWLLWPRNGLTTNVVEEFTTFTFKIEVVLLEVHDLDLNNVIEQYMTGQVGAGLAHDGQKVQDIALAARLNSLEKQVKQLAEDVGRINETQQQIQLKMIMHDDQKADDANINLQQQVNELAVNVNKLLSGGAQSNSEKDVFKDWVQHVLKLPEYLDLFVMNGVETLGVAAMLTTNELSMIGIEKIGHKMQILRAIAVLNQGKNPSTAEESLLEGGSTAYI